MRKSSQNRTISRHRILKISGEGSAPSRDPTMVGEGDSLSQAQPPSAPHHSAPVLDVVSSVVVVYSATGSRPMIIAIQNSKSKQ